jgi:hypothetical protein
VELLALCHHIDNYDASHPERQGSLNFFRRSKMTNEKGAGAPLSAVSVAKKYRIALEDAKAILAEHGDDAKAIHKAARRIAA